MELHSTPLEELSAASFRPVCVKIRIPPTHPLLYAPSPLTPPDTPAATEFIPLTPRTPLSLPQTPALSNSSNPTGFPSPLRSLPLSRPSIAQATSPTLPSVATAPPHRRSRTLAPTMATESSLSQISFVTRQGLVLVRGGDWEELEMERREQGLLGGEATWEGEGLAVWVDESARLIKISLPVTSQPGPLSSRNRTVMTETHTVDPSNLSGDCLTFPSSSSFKSKLGFFRKKQKSTPSPVVQGDCGDNQSSCWGGEGFPSSCQGKITRALVIVNPARLERNDTQITITARPTLSSRSLSPPRSPVTSPAPTYISSWLAKRRPYQGTLFGGCIDVLFGDQADTERAALALSWI